jgi:cytochrome c oxidase subunit 2
MSILGSMQHQHMSMGMKSANAAPIKDSETIEVISKQWAWIFNYPQQNISSTELHLPVNKPAYLTLQSEDVIHGFYIPAFRVKQDVIPGEIINFRFTPILEGKYRLRDSQYSGTYFAAMQTDVVVESPEKYQEWLKVAQNTKPSPAYNQAVAEYTSKSDKAINTSWATVKPAAPPVVNYHD